MHNFSDGGRLQLSKTLIIIVEVRDGVLVIIPNYLAVHFRPLAGFPLALLTMVLDGLRSFLNQVATCLVEQPQLFQLLVLLDNQS